VQRRSKLLPRGWKIALSPRSRNDRQGRQFQSA
jgi:hypothetical protein